MRTKLVIFGITGDLSRRKLLPALRKIVATGQHDELEIIGISRRNVVVGDLVGPELVDRTSIFTMDLVEAADYSRLKNNLKLKKSEQLLIYLALPPLAVAPIVEFLGQSGFGKLPVKLLFEKPFGVDEVSAASVIDETMKYFSESQIYRIDHFLAKEMAQNIVAFRSSNALLSHVWDSHAIESIEVVGAEKINIEGRAEFYEQTGALRDFVQGHLLQLLALCLMHLPHNLDWNELPKLRLEALNQIKPADPKEVIRAQYEGYQDEVDNPGSLTETFVCLTLHSSDPRWEGVPVRVVTGKALNLKTTEIRVLFKREHSSQNNRLVFRIQPDEGVEIDVFYKKPGYVRTFESRKLAFSYPEDSELPDAYEQVLVDAIDSQKSLFTSSQEILSSWRILQPVLDAWALDNKPLLTYPKGLSTQEVIELSEK